MEPTIIVLIMLSTARLTRLVTHDKITNGLRTVMVRKLGQEHPLVYLMYCSWCVSIYTGTGVTLAAWQWSGHTWFNIVVIALSASYVAGFLASHSED